MPDKRTWPYVDLARRPKVLVFGDVMLDRYIRGDIRTVSETTGPVVVSTGDVDSVQEYPGGAANVAANVLSLGADCVLVGITGDDPAAKTIATHTRLSRGCNLFQVDRSRPTTVKTRLCHDRQILARVDVEKTTDIDQSIEKAMTAELQHQLESADVCVVSDYGKGAVTASTLDVIRDYCQSREIPVLVDPIGKDWSRYGDVTLFKSNLAEARLAAQTPSRVDLPAVIADLSARYGTAVIVTAGSEGLWLKTSREHTPIKIEGRPPDGGRPPCIVGAGDTVIAAIAVAMACHYPLDAACRIGNAAAAIAVSRDDTGVVTMDEIAKTAEDLFP